ncbi:hypothetical protein [Clostridium tyrobutyricum]|jgi:hypothetical protein|uniref:hypothetical protein n=1 Tax=Clostridium tyrobutyricum TaxID=1519 RepID=UPI002B210468|nr:hypothetical protein [Clostridium tyrobutyricum]MEA5009055.1 hypothetical protein [Clostridium tyrobutyricum]
MKKSLSIFFGVVGGTALLLVYFLILTFANSFDHAVQQFFQIWYWILILAAGFGTQVGLYFYIRYSKKIKITEATSEMTASGGTSVLSMIACCSHHLVDILPLLGLSAASAFLVKYQISFLLIGVFSNLIGIETMLYIIKEHQLYEEWGILKKILFYDIKKLRIITITIAIFIIPISFFVNLK